MPKTNSLFQLTFPDEGWKETTVYTFEGPHDSGVQHNLVLVIDPFIKKNIELAEYAHAQIVSTRQVMPGFEMVNEREIKMHDGTLAYEIVYKYMPAEGIVLFQKQIFMRLDDKAFIFSATFSKKTLATLGQQVDSIIASLRLIKPIEKK